jgi:hypothetical protein
VEGHPARMAGADNQRATTIWISGRNLRFGPTCRSILPYKIKKLYGGHQTRRIAGSKNHIELLVPGQIRDRIRNPEQILVWIRPSKTSKPKSRPAAEISTCSNFGPTLLKNSD